jgi:hypothetical protein
MYLLASSSSEVGDYRVDCPTLAGPFATDLLQAMGKSGDLSPWRGNAPPPSTRLRIGDVDFESPRPTTLAASDRGTG